MERRVPVGRAALLSGAGQVRVDPGRPAHGGEAEPLTAREPFGDTVIRARGAPHTPRSRASR